MKKYLFSTMILWFALALLFPSGLVAGQVPYPSQAGVASISPIYLPLILSTDPPNSSSTQLQVNAPDFGSGDISYVESALTWFGKVNTYENYTDVRVGYNNHELDVYFNVFDQMLWYDPTPSVSTLTQYDALSIYLNLSGNTISQNSYRFDAQLKWWEDGQDWKTAYRGDSGNWIAYTQPFTATSGWRGDAPNNAGGDRGWSMHFNLPFQSFNLSAPPEHGARWEMMINLYDLDSPAGVATVKTWPENANPNQPATWGLLSFGLPVYNPPAITPGGIITIRQGLNGVHVIDGEIGGHSICGDPYGPDFFSGWGDANYAGYDQINIQNQGDVADWPCFSKFYITFPLDVLPDRSQVISSTLTMYMFGNAYPAEARPSWIQVMSVNQNWQEDSLTWNNAPIPAKNYGGTWVYPITSHADWPGVPYTWDVSQAVAEAVKVGQSLGLVLYEADWDYHSGKYFSSSDVGDWNDIGRPTLHIAWGKK